MKWLLDWPVLLPICLVALVAIMVRARQAYRGSTFEAAAGWELLSLVALGLGTWLQGTDPITPSAWRLVAVATLPCSFMAVLGAKRPQHGAWQFIVATLWLVLALPGWQALAYGVPRIQLDSVRQALFVMLFVLTWINWLGTRLWFAATCQVVGQFSLLAPYLDVPSLDPYLVPAEYGFWVYAGGSGWRAIQLCGVRWPVGNSLESYSIRWRNWRDLFGTIWAFRVWERIQTAERVCDGIFYLTWSGFRDRSMPQGGGLASPTPNSPEAPDSLAIVFPALLRRFLSDNQLRR